MKGRNFVVTGLAVLCLLMAVPGYAQTGGTQTLNMTGTVTTVADAAGTILTAPGATWTGQMSYDGGGTIVGPTTRKYVDPFSGALSLIFNDFGWGSVTDQNDASYPTYPETIFMTAIGECVDINYEYVHNNGYVFTLGGTDLDPLEWKISVYNGNTSVMTGTVAFSQVPVPGALYLLGSGLIGLAGLRKRFFLG